MTIEVIGIMDKNVWYSECLGQRFEVFQLPDAGVYIFSTRFIFYPIDVREVNGGGGYLPTLETVGKA